MHRLGEALWARRGRRFAGGALTLIGLLLLGPCHGAFDQPLFGYQQREQQDMRLFTQWLGALERHVLYDLPEADCHQDTINRCHLRNWLDYLETLKSLPLREQLIQVNRYANAKEYVLDIDNYQLDDYWAIAREFLYNGGDCEDYAITKLFSLLWLGIPEKQLRLVVLQDTNLRIPHAVLAVDLGDDIAILDNQIQEVVSHRAIIHYVPVYSINQQAWWLHTQDI